MCKSHCYHLFVGVIHMVVPPGHVLLQCCLCRDVKVVHRDHVPLGHFRCKSPVLPHTRAWS